MKNSIILLLMVLSTQVILGAQADSTFKKVINGFEYSKPKAFTFAKNIPSDFKDYAKTTFTKRNLPKFAAMAAGTGILIFLDRPVINGAQQLGDNLNLSHSSHQQTVFEPSIKMGAKSIKFPINVPNDINTGMYFLGDGITHFTIAGAFWATGLIRKDNRAKQTASQLMESIVTTGISTQFLKHITGRESPFTSNPTSSGTWRFFPNQKDYANHVPHYDAFPTGHLATAMATVTVIADNYPEYGFVRPVGYGLMGLLGYAMLNNGVHWISDYPLGIALGYTFAKIAVKKGRKEAEKTDVPKHLTWRKSATMNFFPTFSSTSDFGMGVLLKL